MQKIKDNTHDKGFLFVVTREIGEIISDPINIYKIFGLNATYKSINDYMQLENRFFLTIVTNDTKDAF